MIRTRNKPKVPPRPRRRVTIGALRTENTALREQVEALKNQASDTTTTLAHQFTATQYHTQEARRLQERLDAVTRATRSALLIAKGTLVECGLVPDTHPRMDPIERALIVLDGAGSYPGFEVYLEHGVSKVRPQRWTYRNGHWLNEDEAAKPPTQAWVPVVAQNGDIRVALEAR
jgi:hypothetical protein